MQKIDKNLSLCNKITFYVMMINDYIIKNINNA